MPTGPTPGPNYGPPKPPGRSGTIELGPDGMNVTVPEPTVEKKCPECPTTPAEPTPEQKQKLELRLTELKELEAKIAEKK